MSDLWRQADAAPKTAPSRAALVFAWVFVGWGFVTFIAGLVALGAWLAS
jgi:hypothetical protein